MAESASDRSENAEDIAHRLCDKIAGHHQEMNQNFKIIKRMLFVSYVLLLIILVLV